MRYQTENVSDSLTHFANLESEFSNTGYTFDDWNTQSNGGGATYADGSIYNFSNPIVALCAMDCSGQ